ncbi:MAG: helix-turn-helix domain-containing protein [Lachnospiraceae bacterium]|nr:helix-turn-helix domain-containing protein [Lachnospiraceae bacterium]
MAEQLREFMLRAGISIEFQDLARLPYYFNQASIALDLGSRYDSTLWSYRFEHYMLSYVAEQCMQELDAEALCPIGLLKLREYCREKGRDYDVTLRIFLENNMSIANTIRKIHMQRATFLYQLNKIQKIMGVDLQNYETRLQLMIAYQLLDKESKENEVSEREYAEL